MKKATHEGILAIGEKTLSCAVLEDRSRVISLNSVFKALGRPIRSKINVGNRVINMPSFLDAQNLQPYVSERLKEVINPIEYKGLKGKLEKGYNSEILPLICEVYLNARLDGKITKKQESVAIQSEVLVTALSKVGITALIDEATGYQEVRDRNALQIILDKYLTDEWAKWTKRFPEEFYKEIFRLKGIDYPPKSGKKASYVGHWTNDIVYSRIAPGILDELKKKNPSNEKGIRKRRHHQYLTGDIGIPKLQDYIKQVIFLMRTCSTYREFTDRLARVAPKHNETMPLPFVK